MTQASIASEDWKVLDASLNDTAIVIPKPSQVPVIKRARGKRAEHEGFLITAFVTEGDVKMRRAIFRALVKMIKTSREAQKVLSKELSSVDYARILMIARAKKVLDVGTLQIPDSIDDQRVLIFQLVCHQYSKLKMEILFRDELLNRVFNLLAPLLIKRGPDICR